MVGNLLSFGVLNMIMKEPVSSALEEVDNFLSEQNEKIYHPVGLHICSLSDTACLHVLFNPWGCKIIG